MGAVDGCSCASVAQAYEVRPHQRSARGVDLGNVTATHEHKGEFKE